MNFKTVKYLVVFFSITLQSCKNPLDGFVLGFKEPIDKATIRIQFSLPNNGKLPDDLDFQIVGKDADKIVTNLNTKNFKISKEGVLIVAVSPEFVPSTTNPINITIVAESKDYTKIIKTINFTNNGNYSFYFGFVKRNAAGNANANQLTLIMPQSKPVEVQSFNNAEKVSITFPEKTSLLGLNNEILTGNIDLTLTHFSSKNSKAYLPAGGIATNPVDKDNKALAEPFDFYQTAGMLSIEMSTDKDEIIKKFGIPIRISLEIDAAVINPITGKSVAIGDKIPLISYDTDNGLWKVEGDVVINKNNSSGKFEVSFDVSHLTYWIVGWPRNICRIGPSYTIKSPMNDLDIVYYSQLVDASNNQLIRDYFINVNNGAVANINFIPKVAENVKFKVFNYNNYYGGDAKTPLFESTPLPLCGANSLVLDLSKLPIPKYVELDIKVVCPQGKVLDEAGLPAQMKVQYSEPDKSAWKDVGVLTRFNRKVKTYRMKLGEKYDMRGSTDGGVTWPYVQKNYLVDKQIWSFELPGKEYCK
jgi:hypothetical protein